MMYSSELNQNRIINVLSAYCLRKSYREQRNTLDVTRKTWKSYVRLASLQVVQSNMSMCACLNAIKAVVYAWGLTFQVEHPAAKMMILSSQMQEQEVGDGTNFVLIMSGALLESAEDLLRMVSLWT